MSRAEFDSYTLAEFCDIVAIWRKQQKRQEILIGKLSYVVAASSGATLPNKKPIPVNYFHPDYVAPKTKKREPSLLTQFLSAIGNAPVIDNRKHGKK